MPVRKYSTVAGWIDDRKEQQHTTQHEPFLPSKLLQTENTGLTPCSLLTSDTKIQISDTSLDGANFRMTTIHNALSTAGGDHVIASTLCDQVCKNKNVQIQVGAIINKRLRNQREKYTGYQYHITIAYGLQACHTRHT